jgi:hypothetical protein
MIAVISVVVLYVGLRIRYYIRVTIKNVLFVSRARVLVEPSQNAA